MFASVWASQQFKINLPTSLKFFECAWIQPAIVIPPDLEVLSMRGYCSNDVTMKSSVRFFCSNYSNLVPVSVTHLIANSSHLQLATSTTMPPNLIELDLKCSTPITMQPGFLPNTLRVLHVYLEHWNTFPLIKNSLPEGLLYLSFDSPRYSYLGGHANFLGDGILPDSLLVLDLKNASITFLQGIHWPSNLSFLILSVKYHRYLFPTLNIEEKVEVIWQ